MTAAAIILALACLVGLFLGAALCRTSSRADDAADQWARDCADYARQREEDARRDAAIATCDLELWELESGWSE